MSICFFRPNEIAEIRLKFSNFDKTENQASLRIVPKQANAIETHEVYETDNEKLSLKQAIELKIRGASAHSKRHSATTELAKLDKERSGQPIIIFAFLGDKLMICYPLVISLTGISTLQISNAIGKIPVLELTVLEPQWDLAEEFVTNINEHSMNATAECAKQEIHECETSRFDVKMHTFITFLQSQWSRLQIFHDIDYLPDTNLYELSDKELFETVMDPTGMKFALIRADRTYRT
ncbi:MAG: hypothetical protein EZS28_018342 [Streblomastix strix]|uniref:Uncharacterized protein n=1 Tax=Streblomastix strix TaxID=222440 RepID=A0A5J4VU16_9EUKA|nr:MAG: hypothetical protein EZS28_018342 [Streblomastix strix]